MFSIDPVRAALFLASVVALELIAVAIWADDSGMSFIERLLG